MIFNTLLVQENAHLLGILRLSNTHKSVCVGGGRGRMSSSRINNCPASLRHGLDQLVNHSRWDGHPLLLEGPKQLTHICRGVFSASDTCPTRWKCACLGQSLGTRKARGEFGRYCWRGTVWCCVQHGFWHCRVEVQYRTTFDTRNETAENIRFFSFLSHFLYLFFCFVFLTLYFILKRMEFFRKL